MNSSSIALEFMIDYELLVLPEGSAIVAEYLIKFARGNQIFENKIICHSFDSLFEQRDPQNHPLRQEREHFVHVEHTAQQYQVWRML